MTVVNPHAHDFPHHLSRPTMAAAGGAALLAALGIGTWLGAIDLSGGSDATPVGGVGSVTGLGSSACFAGRLGTDEQLAGPAGCNRP
jgi:hypothetical protein